MFGMEADRFTGRKILVVGALSMLGPSLVHWLVGRGAEVLVTDRRRSALAGLAAWLDGAVQMRSDEPEDIPRWIWSDHPGLAGVILADPRDGAANLAIAQRLMPLLARNPAPFVAALCFAGARFDLARGPTVGLTRGILHTTARPDTASRLARRFLDAVQAGQPEVRLGRAGLSPPPWFRPAATGQEPDTGPIQDSAESAAFASPSSQALIRR